MHTLIALIAPLFTAIFHPISGGELELTNYGGSPNAPIQLALNGYSACTVDLTSAESISVAEILIDVVDNGAGGKTLGLASGGVVDVRNIGGGDVRLSASSNALCRVTLLASQYEPEKVIDIFLDAAT
jgi:hypothetical protein